MSFGFKNTYVVLIEVYQYSKGNITHIVCSTNQRTNNDKK